MTRILADEPPHLGLVVSRLEVIQVRVFVIFLARERVRRGIRLELKVERLRAVGFKVVHLDDRAVRVGGEGCAAEVIGREVLELACRRVARGIRGDPLAVRVDVVDLGSVGTDFKIRRNVGCGFGSGVGIGSGWRGSSGFRNALASKIVGVGFRDARLEVHHGGHLIFDVPSVGMGSVVEEIAVEVVGVPFRSRS